MTEAEAIGRIEALMNTYNHTLIRNQEFVDGVYAIIREYRHPV